VIVRADATRIPLPDQSVDLVLGSPPYCDARTYGIGAQRGVVAWVDWMLAVTTEALRVSRGAVIWIAAGVTRDRNYWPACEGLLWEWHKRGGHAYRPCYWHRVGIPGSGGDQWYRADVEYALCFKRAGKLPWAEPLANGHPPKWAPGGETSHRNREGTRKERGDARRNAVKAGLGKAMSARDSSYWSNTDNRKSWNYVPPELSNPGSLLKVKVGGGRMGNQLAHESEAPYPVAVPAFFIRSHCPPGGLTLDPFGGSGTTAQAALENGRRCVLADLRQSQCELSRRRLATVNLGFPFEGAAP